MVAISHVAQQHVVASPCLPCRGQCRRLFKSMSPALNVLSVTRTPLQEAVTQRENKEEVWTLSSGSELALKVRSQHCLTLVL